jgi:hypothetical protein
MSSLAALARHLPAGTLTLDAAGWRLHRPIALAAGGRLDIEHRRLSLVPGAFIEAAAGGTVYLAHTRIVGVGPAGRPDAAPTPRRGFLLAVGGRMQLVHDQLLDLGHVADGAAGITFHNAAPGSRVTRSVIAGSYTGIQITQSAGVRVVRDHISTITADAVDIGSYSRDIVVATNRIAGIGGHGILVSGAAERITVTRNDISNCHQDGIALYNRVTAVTVTDDRITRSLDGIVLTAVTGNTLTHNEVSQVRRYGFRVSTGSHRDVLLGNQVTHTPVGIYLYRHAHNEQLLANQFARDQLDLRIRQDSSRNTIRPIPSNSIIGR